MKSKLIILIFISIFLNNCSSTKPPQINEFSVSSEKVEQGKSIIVSWNVRDAESVNISNIGDGLLASGTEEIILYETTTFNLIARNKDDIIYKEITVVVINNPPTIKEFTADKTIVKEGSKVLLTWNTDNAENVQILGIDENLPIKGGMEFIITKKRDFILKARNGKEEVEKKLTISIAKPKFTGNEKNYPFSEGLDDGRFTIGAGDKRMMFGYPIPLSTSHFVVKVNGKFASNNPGFKNLYNVNNVQYISSTRKVKGVNGSPWIEMEYEFEGIKIIQQLIPVDKNFKEVAIGEYGQHYKIQYILINQRDELVDVGILLLIDTMIDNNDNSRIEANNMIIDREFEFSVNEIPKDLNVFKTGIDKNDMYAVMTIGNFKPDNIYIGNWPKFHSILWNVNIESIPYYDSAIFLKWEDDELKSLDTLKYNCYYGLPNQSKVRALINTKVVENTISLYFPIGSTNLSKLLTDEIDNFIKNKIVIGAVVAGFGDAVGHEKINYNVSKNRANSVINYLISKGIGKENIIPKPYGEIFADQSSIAQQKGNSKDRRVDITIYIEDK